MHTFLTAGGTAARSGLRSGAGIAAREAGDEARTVGRFAWQGAEAGPGTIGVAPLPAVPTRTASRTHAARTQVAPAAAEPAPASPRFAWQANEVTAGTNVPSPLVVAKPAEPRRSPFAFQGLEASP